MRSRSVDPLGVQVPRFRHAPRVRASAWEDVADVAKAYGLVLDPWQENVLQAAMGERSDGQWATPRVGLSVPRQNGKGTILEARELAGLLAFGEKSIIHSAHEQKTARVGFERILAYFENYDDLRKKVRGRPIQALGREQIRLRNGARMTFPARSKGAIRGFSIDCLVLDEAQVLGDPAWQAIQPTISAMPNPQTWMVGTPPTPLDDGSVFSRWRAGGLEGKDHRLCWCEWSADPDSSLDDRDAWAQANPALGIRVRYEAVADERESMDDDGFARERLGMWSVAGSHSVIDARTWAEAGDVHSIASDRFALAVDIAPDFDRAAVGLAGQRPDGLWHVEMDEQRDGASWVAPYVVDTVQKNPEIRAVVVDAIHRTLIDELRQARIKVTVANARDVASACGQFYVGIQEQWLRHTAQPQLATSVSLARRRPLGESWAWNRKTASSDITPLVACTLALWGAQTSTAKRPTRSGTGRQVVVM